MKKSYISVLSLCAALAFPQMYASDGYDEDPYVILCGEADSAMARGDCHEAAARIKDAIAVRPHSPSNILLMTNLGMVYSMMDSDSLALDAFDRVISDCPDMKTARIQKAKVLLKTNRDKDAFETFSDVIALDSLDAEARYYRGIMALYAGRGDVAEDDLSVLKRIDPHSHRTESALATLYALTGRNKEAIPYYQSVIAREPAPEFYAALAGCFLQLENLSEAAAVIADGLRQYPSDPELHYYRAWLNRDRYRLDDARADARRAIELGANPARVNALFASRTKL